MGGDEALAPLTEAQAADLDRVVAELRVVLPDPTARDIHDYIEENMAASMGEWATANRVKKVNTRTVPAGCTYSHASRMAVFNYNKAGVCNPATHGHCPYEHVCLEVS